MSRTLVIAEPGCTHDGRLDALLALIDAAKAAGCDAFKAQWCSDPSRLVARRRAPEYARFYEWLAFPFPWHGVLRKRCLGFGMQYGCTSYLPSDVSRVDPFVDFHKVSSFEAEDLAIIVAVEAADKPALVSTGMMTSGTMIQPSEWGNRIRLLQCTSSYPAPLSSINLAVLRSGTYGFVGLSDHSRNVLTGAVAVGAGASIIEAHLRLDDCDPANPDYAVAFTPAEFKTYVDNIRTAEALMGDGVKKVQPSEAPMLRYRVMA